MDDREQRRTKMPIKSGFVRRRWTQEYSDGRSGSPFQDEDRTFDRQRFDDNSDDNTDELQRTPMNIMQA